MECNIQKGKIWALVQIYLLMSFLILNAKINMTQDTMFLINFLFALNIYVFCLTDAIQRLHKDNSILSEALANATKPRFETERIECEQDKVE